MIGEQVGHQRSNPQDGKRRVQTFFFGLHAGFFSLHSEPAFSSVAGRIHALHRHRLSRATMNYNGGCWSAVPLMRGRALADVGQRSGTKSWAEASLYSRHATRGGFEIALALPWPSKTEKRCAMVPFRCAT